MRKYPHTGKRTLYRGYYLRTGTPGGNRPLLFCANALRKGIEEIYPMVNVAGIKTIVYTKRLVDSNKNPYDLNQREYFNARRVEKSLLFFDSQATHKYLLRKQKGICQVCSQIIDHDDRVEIDHITPLSVGGQHRRSNMRLLH